MEVFEYKNEAFFDPDLSGFIFEFVVESRQIEKKQPKKDRFLPYHLSSQQV